MTAPDPYDQGYEDRDQAIADGEVSSDEALDRAARIRAASEADQATDDEPGAAA